MLSHRWLVGNVAVLLEAGLALLFLGWHVVRDVRVVALLRKPGGHLESDGDGQADGNGSILEMILSHTCAHISPCSPRLSPQPVKKVCVSTKSY